MSHIDGAVYVINTLKPKDDLGFAVIEDTDVWGGIHVVPDVDARDAIDARKLKLGMFCSVQGELKLYRLESLSPLTWVEFTGGGGPTVQYATGTVFFIADGSFLPDGSSISWVTAGHGGVTYTFTTDTGNVGPFFVHYELTDTPAQLAVKFRDVVNATTADCLATAVIDTDNSEQVNLTRTLPTGLYSKKMTSTYTLVIAQGFYMDPYIVTSVDGRQGHVDLSESYDAFGVAQTLMDDHVADPNPHTQYGRGIGVDQINTNVFTVDFTGRETQVCDPQGFNIQLSVANMTPGASVCLDIDNNSASTITITFLNAFGTWFTDVPSTLAPGKTGRLAMVARGTTAASIEAAWIVEGGTPAEPAGAVAAHNALTVNVHGITTFGSSLTTAANAAAGRTALGLATVASSGSAADLTAGTLPAARMPALTGDVTSTVNTVSTTIANNAVTTAKMGGDVTAAGKALLTGADAAAQRSTLGLGTAATKNISSGTAAPTGGADGDIYLQYT